MSTYHTVAAPLHVLLTINGSRFIADVFPASSAVDALSGGRDALRSGCLPSLLGIVSMTKIRAGLPTMES